MTQFGRGLVVSAIRDQVQAEREGEVAGDDARRDRVEARLRSSSAPRLRRVINASGVILHTNLGRAPLSRAAIEALSTAAAYSNLELDLESGRRGERNDLIGPMLTSLFSSEAGLAVNNNAAAVLLALTALCKGREVIVSRAHGHGALLIDDLGSGAIEAVADEPTIAESVPHSDVVTFSGDKLLGGPQAGIALGSTAVIRKLARHPLARAVRIDKLTLAALEATLRQRLTGHGDDIPVQRMLDVKPAEIRRRAAMWSVKLEERGVPARLVESESAAGGGSLPGQGLPTVLLALAGPASRLANALRHGEPPVLARIEDRACCIDARTVLKGEDEALIDAIEGAFRAVTP